jgi:hypothetical protein
MKGCGSPGWRRAEVRVTSAGLRPGW